MSRNINWHDDLFTNGENYTAETLLGDFKVTTPENPLLSKQAIISKWISVPYTNLQLNPYPNTELDLFCVMTYLFHMLRTYVMILSNWLIILWQNALYLYLGILGMCLNTSRNHVSRSSIEAFKSVQEIKQRVQIH